MAETDAQVDMSHRVAHALSVLDTRPDAGLNFDLRRRVAEATETADSFDELPAWVQDLVAQAEAITPNPHGGP